MRFEIIDTEGIYRRLLSAPNAEAREAIFRAELVEPFKGMAAFFGGDAMALFSQWGMPPEQFTGENGATIKHIVDTLAAHDAWSEAARALDKGWAALHRYADRIATEEIVFALMVIDMSSFPLQRGYSGFGSIPGWIMTTYGEPDEYNLVRVGAATVHELHHNFYSVIHPRNFMTDATVGHYMVMEGLAESFAAELYGEDKVGYFVTEFDETRMDETKAKFRDALEQTGFNTLRAYIFGDVIADAMGFPKVGVPNFAGYALGYKVVQAYLRKTGQSVVEATFVPPHDLIAASGFFD